ncbi:hypothetical protein [Micromonospora zamorensis]|uniref:hypothetical protein n=1 Tax=Micromonospora zamorensis TaxID=709883 RepID=UPI0033BB7AE9
MHEAASRHTGRSEPKISRPGPIAVERVLDSEPRFHRRPGRAVHPATGSKSFAVASGSAAADDARRQRSGLI